jgi:phosphodiesterase/alkaline phosphatase D-like protein
MLQEVEQYYFGHYMHHFADPPFAAALAQIPFVFSWDDHDIFDGWGSYPEYLQQSAVFQVC